MLARVLRMDADAPAHRALDFAVIGSQACKTPTRRHCTNPLGPIPADLKQAGLRLLGTARQLHFLQQRALYVGVVEKPIPHHSQGSSTETYLYIQIFWGAVGATLSGGHASSVRYMNISPQRSQSRDGLRLRHDHAIPFNSRQLSSYMRNQQRGHHVGSWPKSVRSANHQ